MHTPLRLFTCRFLLSLARGEEITLLNGRRFRLLTACLLAVCLFPLPVRSQVVAPSSASITFGQGVYRGRPVTFQVVDGLAIIEGDIILGRVEDLTSSQKPLQEIQAKKQGRGDKKEAVSRTGEDFRWPDGMMPYTINADDLPDPQRVLDAIEHWNENTVIQMVERTDEENWVHFVQGGDGRCTSAVGMVGGEQQIRLDDVCGVGAIIHEIGHAVGLWHEQSREDRNDHVSVLFDNIDKRFVSQFTQRILTGDDIGPYDFGSIMHYSAFSFSRNNRPTIETIPPGMIIGQRDGLSGGDIDAVSRMYDQPPAEKVIETSPLGLEIIVDGTTYTAPQSFDWTTGTGHMLDVPSPQTSNGTRHLFGRWSNDGGQSQTITAGPSNTVFIANFVRQYEVETGVEPAEGGTFGIEPPSDDGFYTIRTQVEVTATPNEGLSFLGWSGPMLAGLHGISGNPAAFPVVLSGLNYTAFFTQSPVTTIGADPVGRRVIVDAVELPAPVSFTWAPGSTHTLGVNSPQPGPREAHQFIYEDWSNGGSQTQDFTAEDEGSTVTANFATHYAFSSVVLPPGFGSVEVTPSSSDGYYNDGTLIQATAIPNPGYDFGFWFGDLGGLENPQRLRITDQSHVFALFTETRELSSGEPRGFSLRSVDVPTLFSGPFGYRVVVPQGATELEVDLQTMTPNADVGLYLRLGSDPSVSGGQVVADYSSTGLTGKEMIVVTPESRQPLEGGTYFIALGLFTTGIDVDGTITATVTPGPSPPEIGISSAAFTFTADVGSNPPPQTIEVRNTGSGTLHYGLMTDKPWLWVSPDQGESMGEADPIEVSVNTEGLAANTYNGTITISELDEAATLLRRLQATPVVIPVTLIVSEPDSGMGPTVGGIVSSASFAPNAPAAPGSILAVFGQNFGMLNDGFLFPSTQFEAEGVSVLFDGTAAPLIGVFGDTPFPQINVLAPTNLPEMGQVQVEVTNSAGTSDVFILPMAPASTGIYRADPVGRMYAAALVAFDPDVPNRGPTRHLAIPASTAVTLGIPTNCKADGVAPLADCGEPVSPGVILQIFVTGLGKATPGGDPAGDPLPAGELAPGGYNTLGTPVVTIGGIQAIVDFSGLAPGFSGLYQINARVPLGAQAGDQIPLTIRMPSEMEGDTSNIAIAGP